MPSSLTTTLLAVAAITLVLSPIVAVVIAVLALAWELALVVASGLTE